MIDFERVLSALETTPLNHELFESFALEVLQEQYPGLVPIPGGTDWGRDGDVAGTSEEIPPRLMATRARTLKGVKANMVRGLVSLKEHDVPVDRIILANTASLNLTDRNKLIMAATEAGARLATEDIRDRRYFAPILRRDGDWRRRLLGLPSEPITLSPIPTDTSAEFPGLPLMGRSAELERLKDSTQDMVLYGVPGCGKSRLVTELDNAAFVDKASAGEQLAPDIRGQQPPVIVVDDAGTAETLIKRLLHLRTTEPDLSYRIIAICWPDEKDEVGTWLGAQCETMELDLMERQFLDEIIMRVGVTSESARTEILNQAEGRVGWAVALGSLLLQTRDGRSLLNGRALHGQVIRYLYRAKLNRHVQDILALVAMLDGLVRDDTSKAAEVIGVSRSDFNDGLQLAAHGGLIDVVSTYGDRTYYTRPPMLATVLVAERIFNKKVPSLSVGEVLQCWPDRSQQVFGQVVKAVMIGASEARRCADRLFGELAAGGLSIELLTLYAMLDDQAATLATEALNAIQRPIDSYRNASICKAYANIAYRHKYAAALVALLDLAVGDTRPTNAYPEHPYRLIEAHVKLFNPDGGHRFELRSWTIEVASAWLRRNQSEDARVAHATVARACLSPTVAGHSTHPGHVNTLQLREAVLPAYWMTLLERDIWPQVIGMADEGGQPLNAALVDIATEWLAMGDGLTSSIAQVTPEAQEQAKTTGRQMLRQIAEHTKLSVGLRIQTNKAARQYAVSITMPEPPDDWKPLFVEHGYLFYAQLDSLRNFEATVRAWGASQATRRPAEVAEELVELKEELRAAGITWPDRITCALAGIAETVDNPTEWLTAAMEGGLAAEAYVFVPAVFKQGAMTNELCQSFLANRYLRWATITMVLGSSDADDARGDLVVNAIDPSDYPPLFTMLLRKEDAPWAAERLMALPRDDLRGMMAYAYWLASRHHGHDVAFPPIWFEAIEKLRAEPFGHGHDDYAVPDLFLYMDKACRPNLLKLLTGQFVDIATSRGLANVRDTWWSKLSKVSPDIKLILWELFKDDTVGRNILERNLAGDDVVWLTAELEAGRFSPSDVLGFASGFEQSPDLEALARLLIPRGVDPRAIAGRAEVAGSWGEASSRYQGLVDKFAALAQSDEDTIRRLGEAGVDLFSGRRDTEAEKEHQRRIRGEL